MKKKYEYGDKRNYKKINIYVDGKYVCSTTWPRTCFEAKKHFSRAYAHMGIRGKVTANYA